MIPCQMALANSILPAIGIISCRRKSKQQSDLTGYVHDSTHGDLIVSRIKLPALFRSADLPIICKASHTQMLMENLWRLACRAETDGSRIPDRRYTNTASPFRLHKPMMTLPQDHHVNLPCKALVRQLVPRTWLPSFLVFDPVIV